MHVSRTDTHIFDVPLPNETSLLSGQLSDFAFCFLARHIFFVLSEINFFLIISDRTSSLSVMSGSDEIMTVKFRSPFALL